jgi:hypothetical protein
LQGIDTCCETTDTLRFLILFIGNNFFYLIIAFIIIELLLSPTGALINNFVLEILGDKKDDYGKQRLWGAVGWV